MHDDFTDHSGHERDTSPDCDVGYPHDREFLPVCLLVLVVVLLAGVLRARWGL